MNEEQMVAALHKSRAWGLLVDDEGALLVAIQVATTCDEMALMATATHGVHLNANTDDDYKELGLQGTNELHAVLGSYSTGTRFGFTLYVGLVDSVPPARWIAIAKHAAGNNHVEFERVLGSTIESNWAPRNAQGERV